MCFLPVFMKPWIYELEVQFIKCHGWVIWPVVWARNSYPMILKAERLIHNRCCLGGNHYRQCFSINEMLLWAIEPISFNQWTFITTFTKREAVCSSYKTAVLCQEDPPFSMLRVFYLPAPFLFIITDNTMYSSKWGKHVNGKCIFEFWERRRERRVGRDTFDYLCLTVLKQDKYYALRQTSQIVAIIKSLLSSFQILCCVGKKYLKRFKVGQLEKSSL